MLLLLLLAPLLLATAPGAAAFYLPGAAPADYAPGEAIGVMAVKLASARRPLPCVARDLRVLLFGLAGAGMRARGIALFRRAPRRPGTARPEAVVSSFLSPTLG
jgi:hypothetical protein